MSTKFRMSHYKTVAIQYRVLYSKSFFGDLYSIQANFTFKIKKCLNGIVHA